MNRSGMGLGLTISKMIVQQLGGKIDVESRPDVGSLFYFSFPVTEFDSVFDEEESKSMLSES